MEEKYIKKVCELLTNLEAGNDIRFEKKGDEWRFYNCVTGATHWEEADLDSRYFESPKSVLQHIREIQKDYL